MSEIPIDLISWGQPLNFLVSHNTVLQHKQFNWSKWYICGLNLHPNRPRVSRQEWGGERTVFYMQYSQNVTYMLRAWTDGISWSSCKGARISLGLNIDGKTQFYIYLDLPWLIQVTYLTFPLFFLTLLMSIQWCKGNRTVDYCFGDAVSK